jgi:hypothetical protein
METAYCGRAALRPGSGQGHVPGQHESAAVEPERPERMARFQRLPGDLADGEQGMADRVACDDLPSCPRLGTILALDNLPNLVHDPLLRLLGG